MDDRYDITINTITFISGRGAMILCLGRLIMFSVFFGKLDSVTKFRLLISYCFSLYGSVLWNFAMVMLKVCAAHGESVSDVYGACHLMLIVPYYHYCAVVCLYMMN